jgi:CRP/FNR family cyclic AMP-dependent transcriptional regulator
MDGVRPFARLPLEAGVAAPRAGTRLSGGVRVQLPAGTTFAPWTGTPPRRVVAVVTSGAILLSLRSARGASAVAILGRGEACGLEAFEGFGPFEGGDAGDGPGSRLPAERATALIASRLLLLPPDVLAAEAARDATAARWVLAVLAHRSTHLSRRLARTVSLSVEERLLAELRTIAARHGRPCAHGHRIDLPLTQEVLASMVGATRESVNRALGRLCQRGVIRKAGRFYVVASVPAGPGSAAGVPFPDAERR